jgi:phosphoglycolate phosphatase
MSKKLIAFDFDGTIVESHTGFSESLKEFSDARGLTHDSMKMARGYVDPTKYDLGWGVPLEQQQKLLDDVNEFYFAEMVNNGRFMPTLFANVRETLENMKDEHDMVIITARERSSLKFILDHYGLNKFFPFFRSLCCARERGYPIKPAPDALQCVLKDTKHAPQDVVVIGDTSSDIRMANAAGAKSIGVLWGVHPQEMLAEHKPTLMLEDFLGIPQGVRTIFSS